MATVDRAAVEQRLAIKAARRRVCDRELERAIFGAAQDAGVSQRQISDIVGVHSQATIQRILRRFTDDPSLLKQTPAEIIDRRAAEMITSRQMMTKLLRWTYSFGAVARINGVATDAYTTGDWDGIELAYYRGLLSDNEFHTLAARHLCPGDITPGRRAGTGGGGSTSDYG
ncbi:Uncharacterised protein [Mycobacteroides abscessus subsp. abscessus]|uniref:winged helix-turn-helix domain-containing protein n=1 Tax=Mycobacteroides abscessus TaxID=36809 RepID=UPI00092A7AF6|nr:winged helix-turn-helix domain-containing protein [Mycobacteroides abscessus]SHU63617.1 Uncharacterised protein [Mycobacteroides abscessus subsp. abscessus]